MNIRADVGTFDILGHLIMWLIIIILTFGVGAFFFAYSFSKFIINRTELVDQHGVSHNFKCDVDLFGSIGHIILWIIITILTFGLGYVFYFYKVWNYCLNNSSVS
jgi:uncharacterized membrane protein YjgN (DUF898 family)